MEQGSLINTGIENFERSLPAISFKSFQAIYGLIFMSDVLGIVVRISSPSATRELKHCFEVSFRFSKPENVFLGI